MFPRFCRADSFLVKTRPLIRNFACQLIERQSSAYYPLYGEVESFGIGHPSIIEAIHLLIQVAEQVEGLN
jgi:hypothetical protein